MHRRTGVMGLAIALVVGMAGCNSHKGGGTPVSSTAAAASPSASLPADAAAERDALVAYRGMWSAFAEAAKTSDPDAPDLRKYTSDNALKLIVSSLFTDRDQGKVTKGPLHIDPKVTESTPSGTPTEVKILDCVDARNWLEYKKSGGLWDNEPGGKHRTTATVNLSDGAWKVSSFVLEGAKTC